MKATTLSCSTIRLAMASAAAGSPPSSPKMSLTGWPARPPRALTSALQALSAVMIGWTARPMTPLPVPNVPRTIGARAAAGPGLAGDPGAAGAPAGPAAAPGAGPETGAPDGVVPAATAAAPFPPPVFSPGPALCAPDAATADGPGPTLEAPFTTRLASGVAPPAAGPAAAAPLSTAAAEPAAATGCCVDDHARAPPLADSRSRPTRDPHPAARMATTRPPTAYRHHVRISASPRRIDPMSA